MEDNSKITLKENYVKNNIFPKKKRSSRRRTSKKFNFKCSDNKHKIMKSIIITENKKEDNIPNIKKIRNPGVDLLRLISMYNIIFGHYIFFGNAYKHFPKSKRQLSLIHCSIDWHNDSFMLISGIVGYKTNKYSNLFYLWISVYLYSVGIHKYILYYKKGYIINYDMNKEYYPIIFNNYWYFTAYFAMYLFLPVMNTGISYLSKYDLRLVVMSTLGVLILWKDYKNPSNDVFHMLSGNSPMWFLVFYLTGAYIGKYHINYVGIKKFIYCFINLILYIFASYIYFKAMHNELYYFKGNKKIELPNEFKTC